MAEHRVTVRVGWLWTHHYLLWMRSKVWSPKTGEGDFEHIIIYFEHIRRYQTQKNWGAPTNPPAPVGGSPPLHALHCSVACQKQMRGGPGVTLCLPWADIWPPVALRGGCPPHAPSRSPSQGQVVLHRYVGSQGPSYIFVHLRSLLRHFAGLLWSPGEWGVYLPHPLCHSYLPHPLCHSL